MILATAPRRSPLPLAALIAWIALASSACREVQGATPVPSASAVAPPAVPASAPPTAIPTEALAGADGGVDAGLDAGEDGGADGGAPDGCPAGMAQVAGFCIDRYEAHLVTQVPGADPVQWPHFQRPEPDTRYEARSLPGVFPQGYISRVEAQAACKNAGKRLCSMDEWQRACEGRRGTNYPYGPRWQAQKCNTDRGHVLTLYYGSDARRWTYEAFNDPELDKEPGFLAQAGASPGCVGDAGAYDLVGNLHEWVSDTVDEALIEKLEVEDIGRKHQPSVPGNGVFLGGFFSNHEELGPGCKYITVAHEPTYHDYSTGFRCCATAPSPKKAPKGRRKEERAGG